MEDYSYAQQNQLNQSVAHQDPTDDDPTQELEYTPNFDNIFNRLNSNTMLNELLANNQNAQRPIQHQPSQNQGQNQHLQLQQSHQIHQPLQPPPLLTPQQTPLIHYQPAPTYTTTYSNPVMNNPWVNLSQASTRLSYVPNISNHDGGLRASLAARCCAPNGSNYSGSLPPNVRVSMIRQGQPSLPTMSAVGNQQMQPQSGQIPSLDQHVMPNHINRSQGPQPTRMSVLPSRLARTVANPQTQLPRTQLMTAQRTCPQAPATHRNCPPLSTANRTSPQIVQPPVARPQATQTQQSASRTIPSCQQTGQSTPPTSQPAAPIRGQRLPVPPNQPTPPMSVSSTTRPSVASIQNINNIQLKTVENKACQVNRANVEMISRSLTAKPEMVDRECQTDFEEKREKEVRTYVDRACSPIPFSQQVRVKVTPKRRFKRTTPSPESNASETSSDDEINVIE